MDINESNLSAGSLQIASEVIEKIARLAALEVDGVADVKVSNAGVKSLLNKIAVQRPVLVEMKDDVADITIGLTVRYGTEVPELSETVQKSIKSSVQNMTQITVAKVNVVINGIAVDEDVQEAVK